MLISLESICRHSKEKNCICSNFTYVPNTQYENTYFFLSYPSLKTIKYGINYLSKSCTIKAKENKITFSSLKGTNKKLKSKTCFKKISENRKTKKPRKKNEIKSNLNKRQKSRILN
ncbi:hypothetical protein BpHYR1_036726 [Brachionus plicatilis]|uniref:Uncharacterized protein n=1 Tax=Brachionus plicatilis TaxID=10195 RepID=A0A3M7RKN9_BRAPC|nr:hypothetical protein BpHYR1_036726 [Brachionus plicatilis]